MSGYGRAQSSVLIGGNQAKGHAGHGHEHGHGHHRSGRDTQMKIEDLQTNDKTGSKPSGSMLNETERTHLKVSADLEDSQLTQRSGKLSKSTSTKAKYLIAGKQL